MPDFPGLSSRVGSIPLTATASLGRQSSNADFAGHIKQAIGYGAGVAGNAIGVGGATVPGGALLSAALSSTGSQLSGGMSGNPTLGGANTDYEAKMKGMQDDLWNRSMFMIDVQQNFHALNEHSTLVSNLIKTKHETQKNSISNIR